MIRNDRVADQNVDGLWSWSGVRVLQREVSNSLNL